MSRNDFSNQQFFFILFVFLVYFIGVTIFAFITGTLWAMGLALPYAIVMPVWYFIDNRVKRKSLGTLVKYAFFFIFVYIALFVINSYGEQWTPYPLFSIALIEYVCTSFFIVFIGALLCERYLKPKLESNQNH